MSIAAYLGKGRNELDLKEKLKRALGGADADTSGRDVDALRYLSVAEYDAVLQAHCGLDSEASDLPDR
jgi:hypothetical protein